MEKITSKMVKNLTAIIARDKESTCWEAAIAKW